MSGHPLRSLSLTIAEVTQNTRWGFLAAETADGLIGWGEATLPGGDAALLAAMPRWAAVAMALPEATPAALPPDLPLPGLADAAIVSALDQALWDIAAQRDGRPLAEALGAVARNPVPLYANINRRTRDRSPAGFAASARDAAAAGFRAFKIAPFDGVTGALCRAGDAGSRVADGLARIAATRDAIGDDARLMVDCHWRLDMPTARHVIEQAAMLGVHWVECPLPETVDVIPDLRRLRDHARDRGVLLAGLELGIRHAFFAPFIAGGAYDVMMPDVKYAGGLREMLHLADAMAAADIAFSPHNPTGPICHAASLHVAAVAPGFDLLETQFDETPLFDALADPRPAPSRGGRQALPRRAGLGIAIDRAVLDRHRVAGWSTG